ncbi:hypothetical protein GA0070614_0680 [Micromonospora coxensis]|uniref:Uncharacterized protein n=1 Tax=Micromonospora coxensis TaxID=356852 RepID=A0A1C5H200_9ACTN|nr:hypothetical protein GA0070614_0680 [Micromonospora coxensis]
MELAHGLVPPVGDGPADRAHPSGPTGAETTAADPQRTRGAAGRAAHRRTRAACCPPPEAGTVPDAGR